MAGTVCNQGEVGDSIADVADPAASTDPWHFCWECLRYERADEYRLVVVSAAGNDLPIAERRAPATQRAALWQKETGAAASVLELGQTGG